MLEIFLQALFQRIWDLEKISMLCYIPWMNTFISEIVFCWTDDFLAVLWEKLFVFKPDRICWTLSLAALQSDTCNNLISKNTDLVSVNSWHVYEWWLIKTKQVLSRVWWWAPCSSRVQSLNDCRHVAKDARVHQSWKIQVSRIL